MAADSSQRTATLIAARQEKIDELAPPAEQARLDAVDAAQNTHVPPRLWDDTLRRAGDRHARNAELYDVAQAIRADEVQQRRSETNRARDERHLHNALANSDAAPNFPNTTVTSRTGPARISTTKPSTRSTPRRRRRRRARRAAIPRVPGAPFRPTTTESAAAAESAAAESARSTERELLGTLRCRVQVSLCVPSGRKRLYRCDINTPAGRRKSVVSGVDITCRPI